MPLLRRQEFAKEKPPPDLKPDEDVFYCKLTGEIFRDYDQFFERIILCNSLVWSCSLTGRSGLTYPEALETEYKARKQLASFPDPLQKPILFLVSLTHRTRLNVLIDDIFAFCKNRYFLGESVDVTVRDERRPGKVVQVNAPPESPKKAAPHVLLNGGSPDKPVTIDDSDDDEVICLGTELPKEVSPPKSVAKMADASKYTYTIQERGKLNIHTVGPSLIHRKKGLFNRDKLKLYLKLHCGTTPEGLWTVGERFVNKFSLNTLAFSTIYSGPLPTFAKSEVIKKGPKAKTTSVTLEKLAKKLKKAEKVQKKKDKVPATAEALQNPKLTPAERAELKQRLKEEERVQKEARKEERKGRMQEEKARMKEEREKKKQEREKRKEEKRQREEELKEWNRPREDLDCEDLKPLPIPTPVQIAVPSVLFGDIVMVIEYLHCFRAIFNMQEEFSDGLTVESVSRYLAETDINGGYFDLLKFLLTAVFNLQAEELEEEELQEEGQAAATISGLNEDAGTFSSEALVSAATIASQWSQLNYGSPLSKLQLDPFTLTEVLRLHILSSGAKLSDRNCKYQYQQRGGYTSMDDAGMELRRSEPGIIKALTNQNLFDMPPGDKLRLLVALVNQLLTYVIARDTLDENYENMRQVKGDLRQMQQAVIRREKDEAQYWYKKRMDERAKEREEEEQKKADKKKQREDKLKLDELAVKAKAEGLILRDLAKAEKIDYLLDEEKGKEEQQKEEPKHETRLAKPEEKPERISARQKLAKQKEDHDKEIPTENIDWEKVTIAERDEWAQRQAAKEAELVEKIQELQHGNAIHPVGRDRTFRRYWVFRSLPGLFIEDQEQHVPNDFLTPRTQTGSRSPFKSKNLPLSTDTKPSDVAEVKSTGSDKENDQMLGNGVNSATPLGELNKSVEAMEVDINKPVLTETVYDQISRRNTVCWSYINNIEQFDQLLESLNPRGNREGPLRIALMEQKDTVLSSIERCPRHELRPADDNTSSKPGIKVQSIKSRNRLTHGAVNNGSAKECLELNLREMLLDLEERVYAGSLGAVKVTDRTEWRDAIENGGFDVQTENLTWSGKPEEHIKTEMEKLEEDSDDDSDIPGDENIAPVVRDLRRALLQIEQGIDKKYLNPPLGEDETTKRARQKAAVEAAFKGLQDSGKKSKRSKDKESKDSDSSSESDSEEENEAMKKTPLERWEQSLMSSTSLPQLFLHTSVLEGSIVWSKSALHARCRICRRKGDAEHMLLCDGCDCGHHMYCLKPPVKNVPRGDWYCVACRPKVIVQTPRKARRSMSARTEDSEPEDEGEEESESEEEEEVEESDGAQELEDSDADQAESDAEEAEHDDSDDDSEDDDDDDADSDDDDDSDDDSDESEEEEVAKPAAVKLIKARGRSRPGSSAPSSGRSTPSIATGRRSKEPTPAESGRASRGRSSLESSGPAAKRTRTSDVVAKRTSTGASKSTGKKTGGESPKAATKKSIEKGRHSRSNSALQSRPSPATKATKRKLDLVDSEMPQKKLVTKSRGGEDSQLTQSENLLLQLAENADAWPFARPVTKREAPDYLDFITTPMDFQTMKAKMNKFEYLEPSAILEDLRLIFENCERYNESDTSEYLAGQRLCRFFVKRVKELGLNTVLVSEDDASPPKQNGTGRAKSAKKGSPKVNGGTSPRSGGKRRSGRRT